MAVTRIHMILPADRRRKLLALRDCRDLAWKLKDHPELKRGAAAWVSKMRRTEQKLRDRRKL